MSKKGDAEASPRLVELPFADDIKRLTEDFAGREWVSERINTWLGSSEERVFILTGEAGIGKSAIAAHLIQTRDDIAAYNFCISGRNSTIVPGTVLRSLAAQLGRNLPEYGLALANTIRPEYLSVNVDIKVQNMKGGQITGAVIRNLAVAEPKQELESLLTAPLTSMAPPDSPALLLIDSLDEAFTYGPAENLVTLLSGLSNLPSWVRLVLTTRPEGRVMSYFESVPRQVIAAEAGLNRDDLRRYVRVRVARETIKTQLRAAEEPIPAETLVERIAGVDDEPGLADGNFLFAKILYLFFC